MRHENKFVFSASALGRMQNRLMTSKYLFSEIFYERQVNNIYLDTMEFQNLFDNLYGVQNRVKHRIRWYGKQAHILQPVMEYKIKQGEMGFKEYYTLPEFTLDAEFCYDEYLEKIAGSIQPKESSYEIMVREISNEIPTLFNTYLRRYFLSGDGKYRVTIDRELSYKGINRWFDDLSGFGEEKIVVELKYENTDIRGAGAIMQDLALRLARNSKYVIGMQGLYFNTFE